MKLRSCVKMAVCLIPELSERDLIVGNCGSKLRLSHRILNFLQTKREGCTGEYWPEVVQVRTKTTEGQYSPVRLELAQLQYCEKVMRAKCANFVLCPCELSTKFRSKIRASFRDVSSVISLKQREKIRRIFEPSAKIRSKNKERKFAAFSRPARKFALKTKGENSPHFRDQLEKPKA